jgi:guanylate kinase
MRSENPEPGGPIPPGGNPAGPELRAPLIVISGPSGVGKTTLVDALLARKSLRLRRAVTATYPGDNLSIFVTPPNFDDLRRRLEGRGEAEVSIRRRLHTAEQELARQGEYDRVLVNGDLKETTDALEAIIRDEFTRRGY